MRGRKSLVCSALLTLCLFAVTATIALIALFAVNSVGIAKADVPADAMWIEPPVLNFSAYEVNVGYTFNVTIWVNVTSEDMFAWQFRLYYNNSHLQAIRAGYTGPGGANSEWATHRTGGSVATVVPDMGANYVMITESCIGDNYVPKGTCASLAWVEFNVTAVPPPSGKLESILDINNPRTWVERFPDLEEIPITKYSAIYSYSYIDTIPPRIGQITQVPAANVQPGQTVKVSVNVTDPETGVKNVTLLYTNDTNWYSIPMEFNGTSGLWEATIPGHNADTTIKYKIEAYDNAENHAVNDNAGRYYIYTVVPEFTSAIYILILIITSTVATVTLKRKLT